MYPDQSVAVIGNIQQAVTQLMAANESAFLDIGHKLFAAFLVMQIALLGMAWMYGASGADRSGEFASKLLHWAFAALMVTCYAAPIPGLGYSFSGVIVNGTAYLAGLLDARGFELAWKALDELWTRFQWTSPFDIGANIAYWVLLAVLMGAKVAMLVVVGFSFIASAILVLLGPIFVPFFVLPQLDWLFWGWLKSLIQYSFIQVVAQAYLVVGQYLIKAAVSGFPDTIAADQYVGFVVQGVVVLATFVTGIVFIPILTSSLFSGHSHGGNGPALLTTVARLGR